MPPTHTCRRLYAQDIREEHGPFTVIRGSHATSPAKLKWLYEVSNSPPKYGPASYGSFRLQGYQEDDADADAKGGGEGGAGEADGEVVVEQPSAPEGFPDPEPIVGPALTLLIADTSSLHARGLSRPGTLRKVCTSVSLCLCVGTAATGGRLLTARHLPPATYHPPDFRACRQPDRWRVAEAQSVRDGEEFAERRDERGVRRRG